ncbi:MAG: L-fucokinase [Eubacteriales bacterium]|nr:L-fucokinase [Eubacteriales bacterium]
MPSEFSRSVSNHSQSISSTVLTAMFLQSAMRDSEDDYHRSLTKPGFPHWDAVIITASNEQQAIGYREQIKYRRSLNRLPSETEFIIVPDRDNKRVGSAGSTLSVIRELQQRFGSFSGKRFLCIHAGGDSKRCPQYSALGKLFSPVPLEIDGEPATLFDVFLQSMASMPGRMRDGMLLLSGDVILLFSPLMCDFGSSEASVISFKENAETGKDHGVYLAGEHGNVKRFLHKQSVERLTELGAVDERGNCNIDTGVIELSPVILDELYCLVDTEEKYTSLVNDKVRLSLYGDIAYCLAEESSLDEFYKEKPEGEMCDELKAARKLLWEAIGKHTLKLLNLAPAKFVHFGTTWEIMALMEHGYKEYESLGWKKQINSSISDEGTAGYNSVLSPDSIIGKGCYLENSFVHSGVKLGNNVFLSYVDIEEGSVPSNTAVHGLKLRNGKFVCRIWPVNSNPKDFWDEPKYRECDTIREAISSSLNDYINGTVTYSDSSVMHSLKSSFNEADPHAVIEWSRRMEELVRIDSVSRMIKEGLPAREASAVLRSRQLSNIQKKWLTDELKSLDLSVLSDFSYALRLKYYLGTALNDDASVSECFKIIADTVMKNAVGNLHYNDHLQIVSDSVSVKLPLRVNWGGGWTDTCPHCLENGGTVINAAISLNGQLPVEVRIVRIPEHKIIFDSRDMDVHGEFSEIEPLQMTGDPYDLFALQKACLLACGIIPDSGGNLNEILSRLGGGFEIHSEVTNVPKGSGLGTSSILSAAAVKAIFEFTGRCYTEDDLYSTVLAMEQIMSTGGGWQDQVGGITPGIKFITSDLGISQKISVEHVNISEATKKDLSERFCIIYTGQRRLARNLLRDVVGRYVGNEPESLYAHKEIQKSAVLMKFALERGDTDEFSRLLDNHWKLSKMLDEGSSNTLIDQIFFTIDDLIDARMVCGAGGGGFLQVMLKRGITKTAVHERLKSVFQDFPVDIWDCEIVYD